MRIKAVNSGRRVISNPFSGHDRDHNPVRQRSDILAHRLTKDEEDDVSKGILLALGGLVLLAGCGQGNKASSVPIEPKWKGAPYRISFDTPPAKPNPSGVTIPAIKYTANPESLENRARLVVRFDSSELAKNSANGPVMNQMVMAPIDMRGAEGALPADYLDMASKDLSRLLGAYCAKGKVNVSVALARSSLNSQPRDAELDAKRLSDWLPIDLVFKNPHPKC
jgi:hypothetical protein